MASATEPNAARSIPAWAGETRCISASAGARKVYPRVGGGNASDVSGRYGKHGLSPRGRGKPYDILPPPLRAGSIPAWAGETAAGER